MRSKQSELNDIWNDIEPSDEFIHFGMGNPVAPAVIIVEEAPSEDHGEVPWLDREMNGGTYVQAHQDNESEVAEWPLYETFLTPISNYLRENVLDHVWLTSAVKTSRPTDTPKEAWFRESFTGQWEDTLRAELRAFGEIPVLSLGNRATWATTRALDIRGGTQVTIMDPYWWGPTPLSSARDLAHGIHWYAPRYDPSRRPKFNRCVGVLSHWLEQRFDTN